jgi:hypothetical protein
MAGSHHLMLRFAAATGIAALLWTAAPVVAAEHVVPASKAAGASMSTAPSVIESRAWRGSRIAASYYRARLAHRVSPIRSDLNCSGVWCGRQFVLMLGIGY